jgi:murein DD-endopeptidase MepM/ murein hydrolase activator NlpD
MNTSDNIKLVTMAIILLICCITADAQFFTVRHKDKEKEVEVEAEKITAESGHIPEKTTDLSLIENMPALNENTKWMLDGMRKRQYISLPVDELKINSPYGYRTDPFTGKRQFHSGVDIDADFNYVYCVMPGKVIKSGKNRALGEFVQIEHGEFRTTYGHLMQRLVEAKTAVEAGQTIGISGSSGRSTGEHLHFCISFKGKSIDPAPILDYFLQVTKEARKELENMINSELSNK